jgi:hypothetical protein
MDEKVKKQIDEMDYEAMLRLWRNAMPCAAVFQGDTGDYFSEVMKKKRAEVGNDAHVAASKRIDWDGR